jgi:hypothetical protein
MGILQRIATAKLSGSREKKKKPRQLPPRRDEICASIVASFPSYKWSRGASNQNNQKNHARLCRSSSPPIRRPQRFPDPLDSPPIRAGGDEWGEAAPEPTEASASTPRSLASMEPARTSRTVPVDPSTPCLWFLSLCYPARSYGFSAPDLGTRLGAVNRCLSCHGWGIPARIEPPILPQISMLCCWGHARFCSLPLTDAL